jgi:hypothetical protein
MEMDAAAPASAFIALESSTIDQVAQTSTQTTATAPTVLARGKKEMTAEARAAESKKRSGQRVMTKQREKDKKLAEEKVKQAEILQSVQGRATIEALAKQADVHAVAMLKDKVVTQFTADQFGSTASSVSSMVEGWHHSASPTLSSTGEPPPKPIAPSRLDVPTSSEVQFIAGSGVFQPVIDLNRTPIAGDTSSGHSKAPRVCAMEDLPDATDLLGQMPTQPMGDEVLPWSSTLVHWHCLTRHNHYQYAGRHLGQR